jgi:hypothetical protein
MSSQRPASAGTYEEGQAAGGEIILEETPKEFRSRQRDVKAFGWFVFGMLAFVGGMILFTSFQSLSRGGPPESVLTPILFGAGVVALASFILRAFYRGAKKVTPIRVYENGYSEGWGPTPFLPKAAFYSIDERMGSRRGTPYVVVTFQGGYNFSFTAGTVKRARTVRNYEALFSALRRMEGGAKLRSELWSEDAWQITGTLRHYRGPVRAMAETVANLEGASRIDAAFLDHNWEKIRKVSPYSEVPAFKYVIKSAAAAATDKKASEVGDNA